MARKKKVTFFNFCGTVERTGINKWQINVEQKEPPFELSQDDVIRLLKETNIAEEIEEDDDVIS